MTIVRKKRIDATLRALKAAGYGIYKISSDGEIYIKNTDDQKEKKDKDMIGIWDFKSDADKIERFSKR